MQLSRIQKTQNGFALTSFVFIATIVCVAFALGNFEKRLLEVKSTVALEASIDTYLDLENCRQYVYHELLTDELNLGENVSGCSVLSITQDNYTLSVLVEKNDRQYQYQFRKKYAQWETF